jgi:hypothetical protein
MADQLRSDIIRMINSNDDTVVNIKNILQPISQCIDSPIISQNINEIVTIMLTDRDKNNKFDINDLKMISEDPFVIMHLVTLLLMILTAVPTLKITINVNETEMVIFKLLMYIFLIIIPSKTACNWTTTDKMAVLDLSLLIFQTMQSSQMVKNGINKIAAYVKTSRFCSCLTIKTDVIEDKVPDAKVELEKSLHNAKNTRAMQEQIKKLEKMVIH